MNDLQLFNNPRFGDVRTLTEDGNTLFCGIDVAHALGTQMRETHSLVIARVS